MSDQTNTLHETEVVMRLPKFSPGDIGAIIGPGKAACEKNSHLLKLPSLRKEVVSKAWSSYKTFATEEKLDVTPKSPYIQINKDDDGVFALIKTDSIHMLKFTQLHLSKYQDSFIKPQQKMIYTIYTGLPHHLVPRLIGRGGSTIQSMRTEAVSQMDEEVDVKDLRDCEKSYLKVDKFVPNDFDDFVQMVNTSDRAEFAGWQPSEGDELVKIFVTSFAAKKSFQNFVECLSGAISNGVADILDSQKGFHESKKKELEECYEAMDSDW